MTQHKIVELIDTIQAFDPEEAFYNSKADWPCDLCQNWRNRQCAINDPQRCPSVLEKAHQYLTDYITPEEVEDFLRYSLADDLLAAELARRAGLDITNGIELFKAFEFWARGLRS